MTSAIKLSVTIITFNEEKKLERCLQSVLEVADEILVVDSFSTDSTESICSRYPVKFVKNKFGGYVSQKNFAMNTASHDFILSLDADEALSEEMKRSVLEIKSDWGTYHGYSFNRFNCYCGKWIKHSGWYPDRKIRLWDRRKGGWSGTDPHDKVVLNKKDVAHLPGDILHLAYLTVDEHLRQMNKFADVAARAKYQKGEKPVFLIHVILNPCFKFLRKYILQLGFLDGYYGFVFCAVASSLNFFKYLKLYEYHKKGIPVES